MNFSSISRMKSLFERINISEEKKMRSGEKEGKENVERKLLQSIQFSLV